ncbi:MAG: heterodisulfide reductase-related iron-sulfur binding cluster [Bacteroidota bacterium]
MKNLAFLAVFLISMGLFAFSVRRLFVMLKVGKPDNRFDHPLRRLWSVFDVALGQTKILREPVAGLMHAFIFWGFVVLLTAVLESIFEGLIPGFSPAVIGAVPHEILAALQDGFAALVILGVLIAFYRRFIVRPKRLELDMHSKIDATAILLAILLIMISMLGQNATRMLLGEPDLAQERFVSALAMPMFASLEPEALEIWFEIFWWTHSVLVLGFLNYLPYSKHLHVLTSVPNVYFSSNRPKGALKPLNLEAENVEKFGVSDIDDLTWKQLLDGYTCTECGRCTDSCPANITGKILSPRKIIMDIRDRTFEKAPLLASGVAQTQSSSGEKNPLERSLLHNYITPQELWACTTCMACVQECPVNIEHVDAIVDMRRNLVLMESAFPPEVQTVFRNLENNFTPWAFGASSRADWAEGMGIPRVADTPDAEVLFWVGCAGSYDARYKKVTQAFAALMKMAGIRFAILGTEEKCTGDPARRIGNEYLAQILIKENVQTLNNYKIRKIVTTCPHCFNSLLNEYPDFGGKYEVVHHTDFLWGLVNEGRIRISPAEKTKITYHDSCYLGRYNQIYDAPRETLRAIPGLELAEMKRSRSRGLCCGAGGGQMWMEEKEGKRVNIERTEEALSLKPDVIGTACPFCMTMMTDGVKAKEASETVQVKDIAEILYEAAKEIVTSSG